MVRHFTSPLVTFRPAFTLIEVLVAMAVLATISVGLLVTTWRLIGFAREEAEHMVADAYCHDVMWAVYSQSYTNMLVGAVETPDGRTRSFSRPVDPVKELPYVESVNMRGQRKIVYPLWRSQDPDKCPTCSVLVKETETNKLITVSLEWYSGSGERASHTNAIVRAPTDRRSE